MIDLDALERAAKKATPGPWHENNGEVTSSQYHPLCKLSEPYHRMCTGPNGTSYVGQDAEFIALANPETVLKLCRVVEAAKRACAGLLKMARLPF